MTDLIGFVMPFFIDFVNGKIVDSKVKFAVSLLSCIAVAVVLNLNKLLANDVGSVLTSAGIIFSEAQIAYKLYWEKSQLRSRLELD